MKEGIFSFLFYSPGPVLDIHHAMLLGQALSNFQVIPNSPDTLFSLILLSLLFSWLCISSSTNNAAGAGVFKLPHLQIFKFLRQFPDLNILKPNSTTMVLQGNMT